MRRSKTLCLIVILIMLFSIILTGCGGSKTSTEQSSSSGTTDNGGKNATNVDQQITIRWSTWGNPGELQRFQELNKEYMKLHPNVKIEFLPVPNNYDDKIMTQIAGGTAPDVFYASETLTRRLINNGKIEELDKYFELPNSTLKKEDFIPELLKMGQKDGKTYGLPVDCNPLVIYYNLDLIKSVGMDSPQDYYDKGQWNWDTFKAIAQKLKKAGKYGYILDNWWGPVWSWVASAWSDPSQFKVYSDDGKKILLDNPNNIAALKFLADGIKDGSFTYAGSLPQGQGSDAMFMSGQLGFASWGRWEVPMFKKITSFKWDIIPYPTKDGQNNSRPAIAQAFMVMNKNAKNKDAVWEFMQYFNGKEGQTFRLKGQGNAVPSITGIDELVTNDTAPEHRQYFIEGRNKGFAPFIPEMGVPEMQKDLWPNLDLIWLKKASVDSMLPKIIEKVNQKLANATP